MLVARARQVVRRFERFDPVDIHMCELDDPDPSVPSVADEKWRSACTLSTAWFPTDAGYVGGGS